MCCAQKKPVILYWDRTCWLFVEEGVFEQPPNFHPGYYKIVIWTLVDSADSDGGPPVRLISHGTQHFVIYTTSPTPSRWNRIHQTMLQTICVMNPWTGQKFMQRKSSRILILRSVHVLYCPALLSVPQACPYQPLTQYMTSLVLPRTFVLERRDR